MRVIIIGGGIGGLTAVIALHKRGVDAQVYERSVAMGDVGAGIALWPNAVKALRKLGLGGFLQSISVTNVDSALRRWDGTFISRTSAREFERRFGGGVVVLHRAELLHILARSAGAGNIHLGHDLSAIDTNDGKRLAWPCGSNSLFRLHGLAFYGAVRSFAAHPGGNMGTGKAFRSIPHSR